MSDPESSANAHANAHDDRPPINAAWMERMRTQRPEFLTKLFTVFLEEEPARLARIRAAVEACDLEQVRNMAHSLKGASATLGMERLCDRCRELEYAARDGHTDDMAGVCGLIAEELEAVFAVMRGHLESSPADA